MLAAFGSGWFDSLEECAEQFIHEAAAFYPKEQNVQKSAHSSRESNHPLPKAANIAAPMAGPCSFSNLTTQKYKTLFELYKNIYVHTKDLNTALKSFRQK
jgi:xylulokinase